MLALEPLRGLRVVAEPRAIDGLAPGEGALVLRLAPDDALVLDSSMTPETMRVADEHAIVEAEAGFAGCWLAPEELDEVIVPHVEWPLPAERPALAQGFVAGVPAKLWLTADGALLLCAAAYAHELTDRLR